MEKEKVLEIEFQPVFDKWAWKVTKQNVGILKRGKLRDEELKVYSVIMPQYFKNIEKLAIWGENCDADKNINICTAEEKALIEEKVKAINEKYGIKKRWRAEEDNEYYYIDSEFSIRSDNENYVVVDNNKYMNGNYFKTENEALEYAEYMKKCSLEWHEMRGNNE